MRKVLISLLFFCLTACQGSGSGSDQSPDLEPKPEPRPGVVSLSWGELSCQKFGNCANPVLNLNRDELEYQLRLTFKAELVEVHSVNEVAFYCGVAFGGFWDENFSDIEIVNDEAYGEVGELGRLVLDLPTCQIRNNLSERIDQYFINTKEYKNETSKEV